MKENVWIAASDGDIARVREILDNKEVESVNTQDENGYSALHAAVSYGHEELIVVLLDEYKADINLRDTEGDVPLLACEEPAVLELLLSKGADLSARNDSDQDICYKAVEDENETMISYLLSKDILSKDRLSQLQKELGLMPPEYMMGNDDSEIA
jgi:uncharacterized protein